MSRVFALDVLACPGCGSSLPSKTELSCAPREETVERAWMIHAIAGCASRPNMGAWLDVT